MGPDVSEWQRSSAEVCLQSGDKVGGGQDSFRVITPGRPPRREGAGARAGGRRMAADIMSIIYSVFGL